jgi:hypothetical protein
VFEPALKKRSPSLNPLVQRLHIRVKHDLNET